MASLAAKLVARKLFQENSSNNQGREDPYFETVPATRLGGLYKTSKKRKRALPPGLTPEEERILTKAKRRAYRIDLCLGSFLGTRFGWGAVIGLVPAIGDFADLLLALMVYRTCCSIEPGLPSSVKMRMQMNVMIDFLVGLIPFVGDLADAAYKCNTKNVVLLESELRARGQKRIKGTPQANVADPSLPDEWDYQNDEAVLNAQNGPPPRYTSQRESRRSNRERQRDLEARGGVQPPLPARTR
ncbi:PH domain protein [Cladophialophora carrionii]|uniref:PH domain protein n=1 Tax=Cladophialophora carrionii TaxID=86049 RepID=A0A1C1C8Z9_9EURO|nr:PH domain protein [Cladophialophora carrionii]